jgi:hypothetical protein
MALLAKSPANLMRFAAMELAKAGLWREATAIAKDAAPYFDKRLAPADTADSEDNRTTIIIKGGIAGWPSATGFLSGRIRRMTRSRSLPFGHCPWKLPFVTATQKIYWQPYGHSSDSPAVLEGIEIALGYRHPLRCTVSVACSRESRGPG